jgi:hypothetical protein
LFNNGQYDSKFYQEAKYFKALNATKDVPVRDFDPLAKVKAINNKGQKQEAKVISIFRHWKAVAAAMLLGIASVWVVKATLNNQTVTEVDSAKGKAKVINIVDPESAEEYTEDAVKLMASVFKTGTGELQKGLENLEKVSVINA